jgi:hypothetical protein
MKAVKRFGLFWYGTRPGELIIQEVAETAGDQPR